MATNIEGWLNIRGKRCACYHGDQDDKQYLWHVTALPAPAWDNDGGDGSFLWGELSDHWPASTGLAANPRRSASPW
jgi:hypothetical protein